MKYITLEQARQIAADKLVKISSESGEKCVIASINELEDKGWIFGYNSEAFIKYHRASHCLVGNVPLFVLKTGELRYLTNDEYNSFLQKEN